MHSFKEIVARLVIVASVVMIVETRARYIYQPGPFVECQKLEIPCGGHSDETCNEYCEGNGFSRGSCDGHCCLCFARNNGLLPLVIQRQHSVDSRISTTRNPLNSVIITNTVSSPSISEPELSSQRSGMPTSKPKRSAEIANQLSFPFFSKSNVVASIKVSRPVVAPKETIRAKPDCDTRENVCLTPACVKTANAILENLNEDVSPCDDFYQFACGNFQKDQRIPDDKGAVTLMGSINDKLTEQLREMLEDPQDHNSLPHSSRLAKTLYDSCMNSDLLEQSGLLPLQNLLKALGGWPVLEEKDWNSTAWSWESAVASFRQLGLTTDYLLKVSVVNDLKNPNKRTLHIGEPALAFNKEQMHNPHFIEAYRKFQVNVAVLMGAEPAHAAEEMNNVFNFERTLANISLPRELSRAHPLNFYHPTTVNELQIRFPNVNWLSYLSALLPKNVDIDETQVVNVHVPEQLAVLLNTIDKTDKRVLANYMLWRTSSAVLSYLNEKAVRAQHDFTGTLSGRKQRKPRWRECVDITSKTLGQAVGAMYVRKHFDETSKEIADEMVTDIRSAFLTILATMDWMDEDTKARAFEKASAMKTHIGYPKEILDEETLEKLYSGLVLSPDNFFGNILNLTKGATDFGMGKLKQPVNKNDWMQFGKPAMVNAFYQPNTNSIQFPAGILQGHFFDKSRPSFMNYGAIGWVIGHEITHGYDDQGSHFDLNGDLNDWWNPVTKRHFHEKAKCLVQQYGSFSYKDPLHNVTFPINGVISVGENIADNGGIKQAYEGYQAWVQRNGEENKLPGLKYTPNQLFWISAANNWCSKIRPQQMVEQIQMGVHSPGEYRVRGTFANLEQFAKDFSCPVGSPMNPPTKCNIW